jgi:cardiolipin synthase (CMP-forming)
MRWFRNLPNLLTAARIVLALPVALKILDGEYRTALAVAALAGATDAADGYLARRFAWSSQLGAYLDPLADKLLLVAVYLALGANADVPVWLVALVFGRDVAILLGAACVYGVTGRRRFPPSLWGKISTILQVGAALIVLGARAGIVPVALVVPAVYSVAAGTAWSGLHYLWLGARMMSAGQNQRR